jgi:hypothetical protein
VRLTAVRACETAWRRHAPAVVERVPRAAAAAACWPSRHTVLSKQLKRRVEHTHEAARIKHRRHQDRGIPAVARGATTPA